MEKMSLVLSNIYHLTLVIGLSYWVSLSFHVCREPVVILHGHYCLAWFHSYGQYCNSWPVSTWPQTISCYKTVLSIKEQFPYLAPVELERRLSWLHQWCVVVFVSRKFIKVRLIREVFPVCWSDSAAHVMCQCLACGFVAILYFCTIV